MIIYLSGPISSRLNNYKTHFQSVYHALTAAGHSVISPHFLPLGLNSYQDYMNIAHPSLKASEAIYLLRGWQESEGSKAELKWAIDMGKIILLEDAKDGDTKVFNNKSENRSTLLPPELYEKVREGKITLNQDRVRMGLEPIPYGDAPLTQK